MVVVVYCSINAILQVISYSLGQEGETHVVPIGGATCVTRCRKRVRIDVTNTAKLIAVDPLALAVGTLLPHLTWFEVTPATVKLDGNCCRAFSESK
jgi:hypothetical protein